jgi:hypothetical protein
MTVSLQELQMAMCAYVLCPGCRFGYNANSKDTGGLVGDDWQTLVWRKLTW